MTNRNGDSQKLQQVKELLEKVAPTVKGIIESFDPDNQEIVEIENIDDLTLDEFYDPKMNASFAAHNSDFFHLDEEGRIGFDCEVYDFDENNIGRYTFMRQSLGKAFEDYNITMLALISCISEQFFEFRMPAVVDTFFQSWRDKLTNKQLEEIDAKGDQLFYEKIKGTKGLDAVIKAIDELENA